MAKSKKTEFPYRKSDDKALADGQQVAKARYHREVDAAARSILKDMDKGLSESDLEEALDQRIDEDAESANTYTRDSLEIIMYSDRWEAMGDAIDQGIASFEGVTDVSEAVSKIAFWAYRQDLREQVEAHKSDYFGSGDESSEENPMTNTYWSIDTGNGDQITTGLQPEVHARRVAQRIANERGESVYLYESGQGEDVEAEEIEPD